MGKTYKDLKKQGNHVFEGPEVKQRKHFAPATKTEKPKKGKGSFKRKKGFDEDEQEKNCWDGYKKQGTKKKGGKTVNNCVKESTNLSKFIEAIMTNDYAEAHKSLKQTINSKIQNRIAQEIDNPLF